MRHDAAVLACRIEAVSVVCFLQTIEAASLTGTLTGEGLEIRFVAGAPVADPDASEACLSDLFELFVRDRGDLSFEAREVSGTPLGDTFALYMEGCRLADEWSRLRHTHLERVRPGAVRPQLAAHLDGSVDLTLALALSKLRWSDVADEVTEALASGALVSSPGRSSAAPTPDTAVDFDELVSAGRRALKERAFDEAIGAFRRALELRPESSLVAQNLRRTIAVRSMEDSHER